VKGGYLLRVNADKSSFLGLTEISKKGYWYLGRYGKDIDMSIIFYPSKIGFHYTTEGTHRCNPAVLII